jgi:hypothetical protein
VQKHYALPLSLFAVIQTPTNENTFLFTINYFQKFVFIAGQSPRLTEVSMTAIIESAREKDTL